MAQKKWNIAAVWAKQEATFSTDPDATGAAYAFVKATEATFQPSADVIDRPGLTNTLTRQAHVIGAKGGKFEFSVEMKASGTAAVSAVAAIASESSPFLECATGTVTRGSGTTVAASSGDGSVGTPLKVASIATLSVGMMISINGDVRFIKTMASASAVVLNKALTATPALNDVVTASSMFTRANSGHKSLALVGKRDGIEYTFLGGKVSVKLDGLTARGTALLKVTVDVNSWSVTTKASLPSTTPTGITAVKAPVVKGASVTIDGTETVVHSADFDPGLKVEFIDSIAATEGRAGIEATASQPKGTIHPFYAAQNLSDFYAGTERELAVAVGTTANGFGIYVPKAQYTQPGLENHNGMVGESMPFMVNDNGAAAEYTVCQF